MGAETAYHGEMGEQFAANATSNAYNAHTDRPAMLKLAGDVRGLRVLDLGCGAGHYAADLLKLGAQQVIGVEGSETLLRAAQERIGDNAVLHHHDLEEPLAFLVDQSFDLAVMALVYHHIDARRQLLAEIRRVVRPGGALLVSTTHPTSDWSYFGGSYFADERVELPVGDGFTIRYWRMTLEKGFWASFSAPASYSKNWWSRGRPRKLDWRIHGDTTRPTPGPTSLPLSSVALDEALLVTRHGQAHRPTQFLLGRLY